MADVIKFINERQIKFERAREGSNYTWTVGWLSFDECPTPGEWMAYLGERWMISEWWGTRRMKVG
jgi:hypothetical protein